MKAHLLSTVAASLLIAGVAHAQSPNMDKQAPARAPAAQQSAPAEKVGPSMKGHSDALKGKETTGQAPSEGKMDKGASTNKSMDKSSSGAMDKSGATMKSDTKSSVDTKSATDKSAADSKTQLNKSATDSTTDASKNAASSTTNTDTKAAADAKSSTTTGQGAAAGQAKLSSEQQTKITTAFKQDKSLKSVSKTEINVSLSVGTKIPSHVHLYPVPTTVISVHPEWRGYYVILVDGEYVIIEPKTREIVYIIT
jgi:hypothetical protein